MSNVTLFFLCAAGAVGLYLFTHDTISHKRIQYTGPKPQPTIQFVPHGTPGAMTFDEFMDAQGRRRR